MSYKQRRKSNYETHHDRNRLFGIIRAVSKRNWREQNKYQRQGKHSRRIQNMLQFIVVILQGLLVVVTWRLVESAKTQADASYKAAIATEQSAIATLQSAEATEKTVDALIKNVGISEQTLGIQEKSMKIANRAYLSIYSIKPDKIEDFSNVEVKITLINSGQTPAYDIKSIGLIGIKAILPDTLFITDKPFLISSTVLGQSGKIELPLSKTFNDERQLAIKSTKVFLILTGTVKYLDIFKQHQFFEFNLFYNIKRSAFTYCPKHNDAS